MQPVAGVAADPGDRGGVSDTGLLYLHKCSAESEDQSGDRNAYCLQFETGENGVTFGLGFAGVGLGQDVSSKISAQGVSAYCN